MIVTAFRLVLAWQLEQYCLAVIIFAKAQGTGKIVFYYGEWVREPVIAILAVMMD